jgi:hypothetical protein
LLNFGLSELSKTAVHLLGGFSIAAVEGTLFDVFTNAA